MGTVDVLDMPGTQEWAQRPEVVNDFSIIIATVNGSGSQTANGLLARSMFKMGIPVSPKNLFPSNISGLPTWYDIRLSKEGYTARTEESEILIAFNPATAEEDLKSLPMGGVCIYPDDMKFVTQRDDVAMYALPVKELVKQAGVDAKLKDLIANMVYVGALAVLLGIDTEYLQEGLNFHFKGKAKPVELNMNMIDMAMAWTRENITKTDPYRIERMDKTNGLIMMDGNSAGALGAVFGGVAVASWYPITPSTSLIDALNGYLPKFRIDEDGHPTFAVVQAEDELAAIGIVLGAGWAGVRAMTSTSGPGISLMTEFSGLGYYAQIPGVIFDIQRVGPSTGLPTRTQQGDVLAVAALSHGDTKHVILFPGTLEECYSLAMEAFDLAELLQTPVFVLSDLDLGMNNWMSDPLPYPAKAIHRGKVLSKEDLEKAGSFARYKDVDGDGIGWRTLPGTDHPAAAYFTRGSGHNERAQYSERPDDYQNNLDRLAKKFETARSAAPKPILVRDQKTKVGIIAYGSSHWAVLEGLDQMSREYQLEADYLRLRAYPFHRDVHEFVERHERVYVVEQNRDGQMLSLLRLDLTAEQVGKVRSVRHYNGLPVDARSLTDDITSQEGL